MLTMKEELAKINKKRKTFEDKNEKVRADMVKKYEEELKTYMDCKEFYEFYSGRYEGLLKYYEKRTNRNEEMYLKRQIFVEWKYEYVTSKRLANAIGKVHRRKCYMEPAQQIMQFLRGRMGRAKAEGMMADMFERKGNRLKLDALSLWKVNVKKMKQAEIQKRLDNLDDYEEEMREEIKDRAQLISAEVPRVHLKKLLTSVFMGFKQLWL